MQPITTMTVVQGDSGYPLSFALTDSTGAAINLTGCTLAFKAQLYGQTTVKFTGSITIDVAASGTCHYTVQATDFDAEGKYKAEISITYPSTEVISFVNIVIIAQPKLPSA